MTGFVDIHQHVIYGVDDGPRTPEQMAQMLQAAVEDGIRAIITTPHVEPGVAPFDVEAYRTRLEQTQLLCQTTGWPLTLYAGAEIMYTSHTARYLRERRLPTLADTQNVLVEFLPDVKREQILRAVDSIRECGYYPILAHVERYAALFRKPAFAQEVKETYGVSYQMNARTVLKQDGILFKRDFRRFMAADLVDYIATDAHNTTSRPVRMHAAYRQLAEDYGEAVAARLTGLNGIDFLLLQGRSKKW